MEAFGAEPVAARPWRASLIWRAMALVWLVYLFFPVVTLLQSRVSLALVVVEVGLCAAFVAVYVYLMAVTSLLDLAPRVRWLATSALAILATGLCLLPGTNWLGLYIFVSAAAGTQRPFTRGGLAIAATLVLAVLMELHLGESAFGPGWVGTALLIAEIIAIGGLLVGLTRLIEVNSALRRARDDAARLAVSEERVRFARDLHDILGHHLTVIVLKSELTARLAESDPRRAAQEAREIEAIARSALADVREAITGYRHPRLEVELRRLRVALESAGVEVSVDNRAPAVPEAVQAALAWAAREAATNILRHSLATRVTVRVAACSPDGVRLEVVDSGPPRLPAATGYALGSGLSGLRERARILGGAVEAGVTPDGGYRLAMTVAGGILPGGPEIAPGEARS